jgi:hypothetical protein
VSSDATATAQNIEDFESLFRMGFAGYLVESVCDIALSLILESSSRIPAILAYVCTDAVRVRAS